MGRGAGWTVLAAGLSAALAAAGLAGARASPRPMRIALVVNGASPARTAANVECALRRPADAVYTRLLNGFAVRLSERELSRLRANRSVHRVLPDPSSFVVEVESTDPVAVEARTRQLERDVGFTSDQRYNTRTYRGFAATLGWSQLARLAGEHDLRANPDPWVYIVFYEQGVPVDARTDELERRYAFTAPYRYRALGGFSAELTKAQLAGIATEADIRLIGPDAVTTMSPPRADCMRSFPSLRRRLRLLFVRANPGLRGRRLRGPLRVRFASDETFERGRSLYALATFVHPRLRARTQPEAFWLSRETGLRWGRLGPTNGVVCARPDMGGMELPHAVVWAWLLPPLGAWCYSSR